MEGINDGNILPSEHDDVFLKIAKQSESDDNKNEYEKFNEKEYLENKKNYFDIAKLSQKTRIKKRSRSN